MPIPEAHVHLVTMNNEPKEVRKLREALAKLTMRLQGLNVGLHSVQANIVKGEEDIRMLKSKLDEAMAIANAATTTPFTPTP